MNKPLPIPPRWLNCPRKGNIIEGLFIPFKTPLDERYDDQIPLKNRFTLDMFLDSMEGENLGMVIDLTNTTRFYDKNEIEDRKIIYVKLDCRGHGETPSREQVATFIKVVRNFYNQYPKSIIGIHCTHGFNRTGFMIVSYFVETFDTELDVALNKFSMSRSPGIYKQDYLLELYRRYDEELDCPPAPSLPDWCFEPETADIPDNDTGEVPESTPDNEIDDGDEDAVAKYQAPPKIPEFMEGVEGVSPEASPELIAQVQRTAQKMCKWGKNSFPGSQPVSMDQENVKFLIQMGYKVSWKADGTRYMMLILDVDKVFMIDRDNCVYRIHKLEFFSITYRGEPLKNTLLDGEMIIDRVGEENVPRYLAYDLVYLEDKDYTHKPFKERLAAIEHFILNPRYDRIRQGLLDKTKESFSVRLKPFWDLCTVKKILEGDFSRSLVHKTDGLIFQPETEPYIAGRCETVLKWKPPELNTIDFLAKVDRQHRTGCLPELIAKLYVGGSDVELAGMKITRKQQDIHDKIVECNYNFTEKRWEVLRIRVDKSFPNHFTTAQGVIKSILQPVHQSLLYEVIYHHVIPKRRYEASKRSSCNGSHSLGSTSDSGGGMPPPVMEPPKSKKSKLLSEYSTHNV